ncbi:thiamine phosphate synthase [Rubellimicrobium roseum]|uniref:Thiamine-phosphate synthase n=1 Tax=Rubellimicrobium roseum TaxID=687525 RepID=A0A5C4N628_9RHOB|nr:thiamine phosphate synthase [Rubellimicrobium roseum]TNC60994.1 thiamine phosphate synthase [Rubellimicrobium roseum]
MMLDPFYLIVDDVSWVARLVPLGVRLVQLRVKNCPEEEVRRQVREARAICAHYGAQLIVNDFWRLAIEEGCDAIHLGQEDLAGADLAAIRRAGLRFGISTHDHAELDQALSVRPDYVALGPIYPTRLKAMPWAPQGLERIAEWKRRIEGLPLVAIGGLSVERAPGALAAGSDSLAVVTDVTLDPDPENRVRQWLQATRKVAA